MVKYIHPGDFQADRRRDQICGLDGALWHLCGKLMRQGLHEMEGRTVKRKKLLQQLAMTPWITAEDGGKWSDDNAL